MGLKVTNNAFGTLNASINSSATTIVLVAGQGARFPTLSAGDYFYATLIDTSNNLEIVKCTARSTDTLTVVRAQESTTARAYATNDRLELRPTAALFNEKQDALGYTPANKAGDTITGKVIIEGNSAVWNSTTPGLATGSLHLDPQGGSATNNYGSAITFGAFDASNGGNAQAGIYTASDGAYGSKLFIGTSQSYAAGTDRVGFAMDEQGRVTTPYSPVFMAYGGSQQLGSSAEKMIFSTTLLNVGGHYSTSTYRFTAPSAGRYRFSVSFMTWNTYFERAQFRKNGSAVADQNYTQSGGSTYTRGAYEIILLLAASDYVEVWRNVNSESNAGTHGDYRHFSGELIG